MDCNGSYHGTSRTARSGEGERDLAIPDIGQGEAEEKADGGFILWEASYILGY